MANWETVGNSISCLQQKVGAYTYNYHADYSGTGKVKMTYNRGSSITYDDIEVPQITESSKYNYRIRVAGAGRLTIDGETMDITPATPYFMYNPTKIPAFNLQAANASSSTEVTIVFFLERIAKTALSILKGNLFLDNNYFENDIMYYWRSTGTYLITKNLVTGKVDLLLEKLYIRGETIYHNNKNWMDGSPSCGYTEYTVGRGHVNSINRSISFAKRTPEETRLNLDNVLCNEDVFFEDIGHLILPDGTLNVSMQFGIYSDYRRPYFHHKINAKFNAPPTITLTSPVNNQTLYENSTLQITGTAHDTDADQSVTAYYQINNDAKKVLATNVSKMQIPLNKQLTFKSGKLFDGVTAVSGSSVDGVAHTLKVWAVDSEGAESVIETRTFYVVPNRAPRLEVTPPTIEGNIDSDTFTVSGTYADDDKNEVIISYRINGNVSKEVARGTDGAFDFTVSFAQLKNGNNTISVEAIDSYGAKTSRTIKLNKNTIATPLLQSTVRYLIQPPKGSAQAVLLWLQRDQDLAVTASLHMGMKGEAEAFTLLEPTNTAPLRDNATILEDEFYHEANSAKDHIILQLDMKRSSVESTAAIHLISGVFE